VLCLGWLLLGFAAWVLLPRLAGRETSRALVSRHPLDGSQTLTLKGV
jgi:hypothetical protein